VSQRFFEAARRVLSCEAVLVFATQPSHSVFGIYLIRTPRRGTSNLDGETLRLQFQCRGPVLPDSLLAPQLAYIHLGILHPRMFALIPTFLFYKLFFVLVGGGKMALNLANSLLAFSALHALQ
jgi:hypothetical protein